MRAYPSQIFFSVDSSATEPGQHNLEHVRLHALLQDSLSESVPVFILQ